jgi:hypothetical protein
MCLFFPTCTVWIPCHLDLMGSGLGLYALNIPCPSWEREVWNWIRRDKGSCFSMSVLIIHSLQETCARFNFVSYQSVNTNWVLSLFCEISLYKELFIHSWIALQPFVGPWPLLQFRNHFYAHGRTPWTSGEPIAIPLPTHRTTQTQNKCTHRHPCLK